MPFIPHNDADVAQMLQVIGATSIDELFDEIPPAIRSGALRVTPPGAPEMDVLRLMQQRAEQDRAGTCFLGAGCYDHHIPAAVWDLVGRGEFLTAYTPYQAEASQGTLQLIYEYQSMITRLMAMDVSNASVYDGGSGLGEAVLMAIRAAKKGQERRILVADSLHPLMRRAAWNVARYQEVVFESMPLKDGRVDTDCLDALPPAAAVVVPQPGFFGCIEDVDTITDWAHARGALVIGVVNPLVMSVLKPPGHWGEKGADIVCGEGQPLGIPMASGGPSFGFLCCTQALVRQIPGRIIGKTVDLEGRTGYALTLQAREQHIRRAKATSNICTNQGLLVTAASIHMALLGPEGLARAAKASHAGLRRLVEGVCGIPGVVRAHVAPCFHETVLTLPKPAAAVRDAMFKAGIQAGLPLSELFPERSHDLLVCVTEKRTVEEIDHYVRTLGEVLA
ncbi:MAG: aminomethyl-transferring glycine dehydrogenase subunit GcvPA [Pseudomonadales bacterium]|nr:aminomethyl-transferring glycine dehydrogenase subunit GcvPA [Pseudomonadales bacterium]MCP5183385.1 aminomethyl-transferring glycine dehydrogenase subunit GcvPA [Pseudomonadales bacterium]